MGTSTSRRSPRTPRFGAFVTALGGTAGTERAVSELYSAAETTWRAEVAGAAILPFVAAALDAYGSLGDRLAAGPPELALAAIVRDARNEAIHSSGGSPAVAMGERALMRLLVATAAGDNGLGATTGPDAAKAWQARRGDAPEGLARQLVGEVVRQLALHIASRDIPQFVKADGSGVENARAIVRAVADSAADRAATAVGSATFRRDALRRDWAQAVAAAFTAGRQLPGASGA